MKFSKKSEYGLRALLELCETYGGRVLQRHEIAERQNIPVEFLEQILLALKRAGLLASRRGVRGGYSLIKSPEEITLGQVIRILDGPSPRSAASAKPPTKSARTAPTRPNLRARSNRPWVRCGMPSRTFSTITH
ncbi:MAG: Rrf2 family transcriptional regulator [Nitrospira sp.]|nr:Rrf2 family transcriptional regulator [Nitrospira sp.]